MNTKTVTCGQLAAISLTLVLSTPVLSTPVFADERPLIWQPVKASETSYSVKLGMRLPTRLESEAGVSMGMAGNKAGVLVDVPVKVWGKVKTRAIQRPAYEANSNVDFSLDALNGSGAITMNYYDKRIATSEYDLERRSSYAIRYDGATQQWGGVQATQSLRVSRSGGRGTAVVVRSTSADTFSRFAAGVGVEQKLGKRLTLRGSLDRSFSADDTVASIDANYSFRW